MGASSQPRVEPGFDGPIPLLNGEGTFSSATLFADARRTHDLLTTIGRPAGGDESDLGPVRPHIEVAPVAGRDAALERAIREIRGMEAERRK